MGLTVQSTGAGAFKEMFEIESDSPNDIIIALAGNPNTGKSTIFNALTGLNQHTGNWPGKTVANAQGKYSFNDKNYILVDLPGTYSLLASSVEEIVAKDFICYGNPHVTVVVVDATCLERNLNLVLQISEITNKVILCVNLIDEAKRKQIDIDLDALSNLLGIPVVATSARNGVGLNELKQTIEKVVTDKLTPYPRQIEYNDVLEKAIEDLEPCVEEIIGDKLNSRWVSLRLIDGHSKMKESINSYLKLDLSKNKLLHNKMEEVNNYLLNEGISKEILDDIIVSCIVKKAEVISKKVVQLDLNNHFEKDQRIDKILTSKKFGIPIMIGLLGVIFWLTLVGANIPSSILAEGLYWIECQLTYLFDLIGTPTWIHNILVLGMFRTLASVISVMLPPMAVFFPIFTLLEDLGYLPRIAFNLDYYFKKACTHGKQALTMCMGFGCNAAGVVACRIIDSPRERLIAIITNNFVPCNGRFPTLIALASIFIAGSFGAFSSVAATLTILTAIILGVGITLLVSKILSKTILKGLPSSFTLELPPYRKPQIGKIIVRSIFDRTLFVLGRAIAVAAPAGLIIWMMANITIGNISLLYHAANFLDPFGQLLGMDGYIIMAFILGLPANEIVIPILIMSYMSTGSMVELDNLTQMGTLFKENGWTIVTAICVMLFSLNHWPCATTLWTIKKETQSWKWTLISFLIPTIIGIILCFIVAQTARIIGL